MMRAPAALFFLSASLLGAGAVAQTMNDMRQEGREFGRAMGKAIGNIADTEATATNNLPGYNGAQAPERRYWYNDTALDAEKAAIAETNEGHRLTVDGGRIRPRVSPTEVDATLSRGNQIAENPATYAQGIATTGDKGQCVELPPSTDTNGTFEASCNDGVVLEQGPKSCAISLDHSFTTAHKYQCTELRQRGNICLQGGPNGGCYEPDYRDEVIGSGCDAFLEQPNVCTMREVQQRVVYNPNIPSIAPVYYTTYEATCSSEVSTAVRGTGRTYSGVTYTPSVSYQGLGYTYTGSKRNESLCAPIAADSTCSEPVEVCTDSSPGTREINGVQVTQSCWAWSRTYQCSKTVPKNDCSANTIPEGCTFAREECLDEEPPADMSACKIRERIYTCPIVGKSAEKQYLCGGDLYCINGECEPVEREASTEFKDALVGLNTLAQAGREFNDADYMLFKGADQRCSKPVFGLGNCCGGNGFPIIGNCTAGDRELARAVDKGLTHYVGTYCSGSFLGICHTKKRTYCTFQSKLTRIIQEQGRPQLRKTWGTAKNPDCRGFSVDEFAQLDLSVMNFAEIYNDFVEAAKLPDEVQAVADIRQRITDYYRQRAP